MQPNSKSAENYSDKELTGPYIIYMAQRCKQTAYLRPIKCFSWIIKLRCPFKVFFISTVSSIPMVSVKNRTHCILSKLLNNYEPGKLRKAKSICIIIWGIWTVFNSGFGCRIIEKRYSDLWDIDSIRIVIQDSKLQRAVFGFRFKECDW